MVDFKFTLRTATNIDVSPLLDFVEKGLEPFGLSIEIDGSESDLINLEASYFLNNGAFYIIENANQEIIASAGIMRIDIEKCKLKKMYVDAHYRRKGLGQKLLDVLTQQAILLGYKEMRLETMAKMHGATRLYAKNGFVEIECTAVSARCDRMMEKKLTHIRGRIHK